jgi:hypothetical protein
MTVDTLLEEIEHLTTQEQWTLATRLTEKLRLATGQRIPNLNRPLGKVWMSADFNDPLPDSFWSGESQNPHEDSA